LTFDSILSFDKEIVLENDRVQLRPLLLTDYEYLEPFIINEPDLWRYSLINMSSTQDMKSYIEQAEQARAAHKEYPFIIFDKLHNAYAGCTRYYDIQLAYKTLQLGYTWYGSHFQGTGLNQHCKYLLLEYAFEHIGIERVEFRADNRNERSIKAMEKIGCVKEGVLRNHLPNKEGGRRDSIILSILVDEWNEGKKQKLFDLLK
jgi:N-acetyltransferase